MNSFSKFISRLKTKINYANNNRDKNLWIFGEWLGRRCNDNSLFFANYIAANKKNIKVVWVTNPDTDISLLDKTINVAYIDDPSTFPLFKKAGVVIMNEGYADFSLRGYDYFDGAITVNLWHGVPWKRIGLDMEKSKAKKSWKHMVLLLQPYNFVLANSQYMYDIVKKAFCVNDKQIIKAGFPRNTIFFDKKKIEKTKEKLNAIIKKEYNFEDEQPQIVTYLPTFRDTQIKTFSFTEAMDNHKLVDVLDKHNALIIERMHLMSESKKDDRQQKFNRVLNIDTISTQELLACSDVLITDYSSCFFDFLHTGRPIIHYLYDYEYYMNDDRGLYAPKEDVVAGSVAYNLDELIQALDSYLSDKSKDQTLREERRSAFMSLDKEGCCEDIYNRICEII